MQKNQKAGGGLRKIGRNKAKCERYLKRGIRTKNKLRKFIKHNVPKGQPRQPYIDKFNQIQEKRAKRKNDNRP